MLSSSAVTLGFTLIGDGLWQGGLNYQKSVFELIAGPLHLQLNAKLFITHSQAATANENFGHLAERIPFVIDERADGAGVGARALGAILTGKDRHFEALMREHQVDLVFENARYYGAFFSKPLLVWIPDFQHRQLPDRFSALERLKREFGFRLQCFGKRSILLSSYTARQDCEQFYPRARGRTHVARFHSKFDFREIQRNSKHIREKYDLPHHYFYLPNHFWVHKNHQSVLESLLVLKQNDQLDAVAPVVMSGPIADSRDASLFDRFQEQVIAHNLSPWLVHLGLIPYTDVLALNYAAKAVLNPSECEGWSTPVEEAKAMNSPLIISNIAVHQEQAPLATFFETHNASELAAILLDRSQSDSESNRSIDELMMINSKNQVEFATAFMSGVVAALQC